jgi:hypothetical protein
VSAVFSHTGTTPLPIPPPLVPELLMCIVWCIVRLRTLPLVP